MAFACNDRVTFRTKINGTDGGLKRRNAGKSEIGRKTRMQDTHYKHSLKSGFDLLRRTECLFNLLGLLAGVMCLLFSNILFFNGLEKKPDGQQIVTVYVRPGAKLRLQFQATVLATSCVVKIRRTSLGTARKTLVHPPRDRALP